MGQTLLALTLVLLGIALAAWLVLVAHDIGNDYRRLTPARNRPDRRPRSVDDGSGRDPGAGRSVRTE